MSGSANSPTVQDHRDYAVDNLSFADGLKATNGGPVAVRWAITALFYSAMHALDAYMLGRHGEVPSEHRDRWPWFRDRRYPELKRFAHDYKELYDNSRDARYYPVVFTWGDYDKLRVRSRHMIDRWLKDSDPSTP